MNERDIIQKDIDCFQNTGIFEQNFTRAKVFEENDRPGLLAAVQALSDRAGLSQVPRLYLTDSDTPEMLTNPRTGSVAVSLGMVSQPDITNDELAAGIAHETGHMHILPYDKIAKAMQIGMIATAAVGTVATIGAAVTGNISAAATAFEMTLAGTTAMAGGNSAFCRITELAADAYAGYATGKPSALISLLDREGAEAPLQVPGPAGVIMNGLERIFNSHPSQATRRWRQQKIAANLDANGKPINRRDVPLALRKHL